MASQELAAPLRMIARRASRQCSCRITAQPACRRRLTTDATPAPASIPPPDAPRWVATPLRMVARIGHNIKTTRRDWECNSDPAKLDRFYERLLGEGGAQVLSEETRWLAITHKSFDQGRRGFNDRLALYGRKIVEYQAALATCAQELPRAVKALPKAEVSPDDDRTPYEHPDLVGLDGLTPSTIQTVLHAKRLSGLATRAGMAEILRWTPRMPDSMEKSGIDGIMATSIYAIIGAVALERGGRIANRFTVERILKPLGLA